MIVSAAVRYSYKDEAGLTIEQTMPVHRHKDCFIILTQLDIEDFTIETEGFFTEKGKFLDRWEAADHAYECGQLVETAEEPRIEVLFSEDLWQKGDFYD